MSDNQPMDDEDYAAASAAQNPVTPLRELLREHQQATDCTDDQMVRILCDYITKMDEEGHIPHEDYVIDFVQENLERGPMDIPVPYWRLPMFTPEDQNLIVTRVMEEISDCSMKDLAHNHLEDEDLINCIGYAMPSPYEVNIMAELLQHMEHGGCEDPDHQCASGDFLRAHDDDGDDYAGQLDFAKRMGLINEEETELTDRGREFVARFT